PTVVEVPDKHLDRPPPEVDLKEVLLALRDVMHRADLFSSHHVSREPLSLRERMSRVLEVVTADSFTEFTSLFDVSEGRQGVVVTFMAVLELLKQALIELIQSEAFAPIHVKARTN
ncbi:MAG: segregation/condensation protein A, partial [Gammaproteobacteria bacterium]